MEQIKVFKPNGVNVILIGANGAGKSTIANALYKEGWHLMKFNPLADYPNLFLDIPTDKMNMVYDRWTVVDRYIYRSETFMLREATRRADELNKSCVIIHLENNQVYDDSFHSSRMVQRPNEKENARLKQEYERVVRILRSRGLLVYTISVGTFEETYAKIQQLIITRMRNY